MQLATTWLLRLTLTLCFFVPGAGWAQAPFNDGSLSGTYAFSSAVDSVLEVQSNAFGATQASLLGVIVSDGAGNVSGSRRFLRPVSAGPSPPGTADPEHQRQELVQQEFTGTYEVASDGTGVMFLNPEPRPPWHLPTHRDIYLQFTGGGPELLHFVLAEDGRSFRFTQEIRATRLEASVYRDTHFVLRGTATSQDPLEVPEPEPDPRLDDILRELAEQRTLLLEQGTLLTELAAENGVLKAQLCETLRLLNTPQGQRESDAPEVLEACGTGYAWNEAGRGGRRVP